MLAAGRFAIQLTFAALFAVLVIGLIPGKAAARTAALNSAPRGSAEIRGTVWHDLDGDGERDDGRTESPLSAQFADINSATTSSGFRWMDAADQIYSADYRNTYDYTQANVTIDFYTGAPILHGTLTGTGLKPNFAYQLKLVGRPEADPGGNERIGLTGRWWQEEWSGTEWANGANLNNKGDGSVPNPNDLVYYSRRDIPDATSPSGKHYRYTGYLVFDYFITDANGDIFLEFQVDNDSYHVLWKTSQRPPGSNDGPVKARTFAVTLPDPVSAYETAYPETTVEIFGEWERLIPGGNALPEGTYRADWLLTEESFHGSGLAGWWAAAMGADAFFSLVSEPGLEGWTVFLDANGNGQLDAGEESTLTDADGKYVFPELSPGTYTVVEILQNGWSRTYPAESSGKHVVNPSEGELIEDVDFGNRDSMPPAAADDSATVAEDSGANVIDVLLNDTDAPVPGAGLQVVAVTQGRTGSTGINGSGSGVTYRPDPAFYGRDWFTYTIADDAGNTDIAIVRVNVGEDLDGDGLFDRFERIIIDADSDDGIALLEDVLPEDDFDLDQNSNRVEDILGYDPTNPAECFKLELELIDPLTGQARLRYSEVKPGARFKLYFSSDCSLPKDQWTHVPLLDISPINIQQNVAVVHTDPIIGTQPMMFWYVEVEYSP